MREIKFRAWDKSSSVMVYSGADVSWLSDKEVTVGDLVNSFEDESLMQYTGLKDKNGKEIYEGDILDGHDDGLVKVVWRGAGWECDFEDDGNIGLDEMCIWFGNNSEVIGNIYENPELLKEQKQ